MAGRDDIRRAVLDNGLTVVMREMHHAPVASLWVWYRVGSRNERSGITGISHWVEHMLFKGTPTYPQGQFDRAVARAGGVFNGMTWLDYTTYFVTLPSDCIDLALRVEADRMVNAAFDAHEAELERTVILSERQGHENEPDFLLGEAVQAAAFQVHPYHHEVIGWQCDLESMGRDQLWDHYRSFYVPNNAIVAVAGDFAGDAMLERIEGLFGAAPRGRDVPVVTAKEPPQRGERRVIVEGPGTTAYFDLSCRAPEATNPDYYALAILDSILGGAKGMSPTGGGMSNRSSRLYRSLVETELASGVGCAAYPTIDPYLFTISATVRAGRTLQEVESAVVAELARAMDEPVGEADLAKAIKQTRAQLAYASESVTDQGNWLGFSELVAGVEWFTGLMGRLEAVTAADVQRVARCYLGPSQRNVGWYVPQVVGGLVPGAAPDGADCEVPRQGGSPHYEGRRLGAGRSGRRTRRPDMRCPGMDVGG